MAKDMVRNMPGRVRAHPEGTIPLTRVLTPAAKTPAATKRTARTGSRADALRTGVVPDQGSR